MRTPEEIKERKRLYYQKNKEEILRKRKEYVDENREEVLLKARNKYYEDQEERQARQRLYNKINSETISQKEKAKRHADPRSDMLQKAKSRAKTRNILFEITVEDIHIPDLCPVFGMPLTVGTKLHDFSPTLDRIIPSLGYVPGNVQVLSFLANRMKNSATPEQLQQFASWVQLSHSTEIR